MANTEIKNRTAKQVEICNLAEQLLVCHDQSVTVYTRQFVCKCITLCQKFVRCQLCCYWQTNSTDSRKEPELANTEIKNRTAKQVEICNLAEQLLACHDQLVTDYTRQFNVYNCITLCQKFVHCQFCCYWQTAGLHSLFVGSFMFLFDKQFIMSYCCMALVLVFKREAQCVFHTT